MVPKANKQNNGQSRETGNIGYTRQKTSKTMDNPEKLVIQGTQDKDKAKMDNPEKLVTQGTQDDDKQNNGQSRETGNIGYTRQ